MCCTTRTIVSHQELLTGMPNCQIQGLTLVIGPKNGHQKIASQTLGEIMAY